MSGKTKMLIRYLAYYNFSIFNKLQYHTLVKTVLNLHSQLCVKYTLTTLPSSTHKFALFWRILDVVN